MTKKFVLLFLLFQLLPLVSADFLEIDLKNPEAYEILNESNIFFEAELDLNNKHIKNLTLVVNNLSMINPYKNVNFANYYKSNLHTHTTQSDGNLTVAEVVYNYSSSNYDILAITDHDNYYTGDGADTIETTWRWEDYEGFNETPSYVNTIDDLETSAFYSQEELFAIRGNELSACRHVLSLFNNEGWETCPGEEVYLEAIQETDGVAIFAHPGRYGFESSFYNLLTNLFRDTVVGIEVYNQGDRHSGDRALWDNINTLRNFDDLLWGFSNDDMHIKSQLFRNYNTHYINNLSEEEIKSNFRKGSFTFSYEEEGSGDNLAPLLSNVNIHNFLINISCELCDEIIWYNEHTDTIWGGPTINLNAFESGFVRAVLVNDYGRTYTQPFGYNTLKNTNKTNVSINESSNFDWNKILDDGYYSWKVVAETNDSEIYESSPQYFSVDTTPPFIYINSPMNKSYEESHFVDMDLFVIDEISEVDVVKFNLEETNYSYQDNMTLELANGFYNLKVWANDTAGNSNSENVSFSVNVKPRYNNIFTSLPYEYNENNMYWFNLTMNELSDIDSVKLYLRNSTDTYYEEYALENNHENLWSFNITNLTSDVYSYYFWAEDTSGNSGNLTGVSDFEVDILGQNESVLNSTDYVVPPEKNKVFVDNNMLKNITYQSNNSVHLIFNNKLENTFMFYNDVFIRNQNSPFISFKLENNTLLTVENDSWNGSFLLPDVDEDLEIQSKEVKLAFSLGHQNHTILFDKPLELRIDDKGDHNLAWFDNYNNLTDVDKNCNEINITQSGQDNMCKFEQDDDLIIRTYHLTTFVLYQEESEQSTGDDSSSSGSSSDSPSSSSPLPPSPSVPVVDTPEKTLISSEDLERGFSIEIASNDIISFNLDNISYEITIINISQTKTSLLLNSSSIQKSFYLHNYSELSLTDNTNMSFLLNGLNEDSVNLTITKIKKVDIEQEETTLRESDLEASFRSYNNELGLDYQQSIPWFLWVLLLFLIIFLILIVKKPKDAYGLKRLD